MTPTTRQQLASRQAELVAALVAGAPVPPGFSEPRVRIAAHALWHKRAGEVAQAWPWMAASYGPRWTETFVAWAHTRPSRGVMCDGWDLARQAAQAGTLPELGYLELLRREALFRRAGDQIRRRRLPALRFTRTHAALSACGRVWSWQRSRS